LIPAKIELLFDAEAHGGVVHLRQQSTRTLIPEGDYKGARWAAASSQSTRQTGLAQNASSSPASGRTPCQRGCSFVIGEESRRRLLLSAPGEN
jgi:hypothetical protein